MTVQLRGLKQSGRPLPLGRVTSATLQLFELAILLCICLP